LACSALATGLALLTKTPALILLAAVPVAALAMPAPHSPQPPLSRKQARGEMTNSASPARWGLPGWLTGWLRGRGRLYCLLPTAYCLLVWLIGSLVVVVTLWPAMWARPLRAIERMAVYTEEKGGSPMDAGGFFLGSPVPDPGPFYYLAVLLLRLSPIILIGLAAWLLLRASGARRGVGLMLLMGVALAAILSFLPKKADRYVLPAIPFLVIVAAVGLAALAERWRRGAGDRSARRRRGGADRLAGVGLALPARLLRSAAWVEGRRRSG